MSEQTIKQPCTDLRSACPGQWIKFGSDGKEYEVRQIDKVWKNKVIAVLGWTYTPANRKTAKMRGNQAGLTGGPYRELQAFEPGVSVESVEQDMKDREAARVQYEIERKQKKLQERQDRIDALRIVFGDPMWYGVHPVTWVDPKDDSKHYAVYTKREMVGKDRTWADYGVTITEITSDFCEMLGVAAMGSRVSYRDAVIDWIFQRTR